MPLNIINVMAHCRLPGLSCPSINTLNQMCPILYFTRHPRESLLKGPDTADSGSYDVVVFGLSRLGCKCGVCNVSPYNGSLCRWHVNHR